MRELIVRLNDFHIPYHDPRIVDIEFSYCKKQQPNIIIIDEWHDFYDLSKYDKDPSRVKDLQHELDIAERYMERLRRYCPRSRIILLNSNHLDRLRKYLWREAPALHSLRALNIEGLLNLKKHRIEYKELFIYKGVLFKHGNTVRKFSAYSAKGEFEKENMSGVSGHTHRLAMYFHTLRSGNYFWMESGCACKLDAEYIEGISNWQHGASQVTYINGVPHPKLLPIIDYVLTE